MIAKYKKTGNLHLSDDIIVELDENILSNIILRNDTNVSFAQSYVNQNDVEVKSAIASNKQSYAFGSQTSSDLTSRYANAEYITKEQIDSGEYEANKTYILSASDTQPIKINLPLKIQKSTNRTSNILIYYTPSMGLNTNSLGKTYMGLSTVEELDALDLGTLQPNDYCYWEVLSSNQDRYINNSWRFIASGEVLVSDASKHLYLAQNAIGIASGKGSFSVGSGRATGQESISFGNGTASNWRSVAIGSLDAIADGEYALAQDAGRSDGYGAFAQGIYARGIGQGAHAEGFSTLASGQASHAEGYRTKSIGEHSHSEGERTVANGIYSHSEGGQTTANGMRSHAEGQYAVADGDYSHAEGYACYAEGPFSHAEGKEVSAYGYQAHAEGLSSSAKSQGSHAEGEKTNAIGIASHAEGKETIALALNCHAEGIKTYVGSSSTGSHTEGSETSAYGVWSHVEGYKCIVPSNARFSHAEGRETSATSNNASHAEGNHTIASGAYSHAEGLRTYTEGSGSHAEGYQTSAIGQYSHSLGCNCIAQGEKSFIWNATNETKTIDAGHFSINPDDGIAGFIIDGQKFPDAIRSVCDNTYVSVPNILSGSDVLPSSLLSSIPGCYYYINGGSLLKADSTTYNAVFMSCKPNAAYVFSKQARFCGVLDNAMKPTAPTKTTSLQNNMSVETGDTAAILAISYSNASDISVGYKAAPTHGIQYETSYWLQESEFAIDINSKISSIETAIGQTKTKYSRAEINVLEANSVLSSSNTASSIKNNWLIAFEARNTNQLSCLKIGRATINESRSNYINVLSDKIEYYSQGALKQTVNYSLPDGFKNNVQVLVNKSDSPIAAFTIVANGNIVSGEIANIDGVDLGNWYAIADSDLSDAVLTWTPSAIDKKTWIFGDSWVTYSTARWPYWLNQYGCLSNALLDGYSGENSENSTKSFECLLNYGTPKNAIYCVGMNDGSDSTSPSIAWVNGRDKFLSLCQQNSVTPVFATIPSTPTIDHSKKNAWIHTSGYRYIDFEKAVGADLDRNWYDGMQAQDGNHPTEAGAKALFARFILDFPEISIN